jgi:hypothetical protein
MISMMIDPEFISSSTHSLAEIHVRERNHKEENRYSKENRVLHHTFLPFRLPSRHYSDSLQVKSCTKISSACDFP